MFNEGHETHSEQVLRERKDALRHLFTVLDVKPTKSNNSLHKKRVNLSQEDLALLTQRHKHDQAKRGIKTEIVGDGEEVEVEGDEEDLNENELNLIYRKYCTFTTRINESH